MTDIHTPPRSQRPASQKLTKVDLLDIYRLMLLSRLLDDQEIKLKRQNKIFFQISSAGHEAVCVAAGKVLKPTYDWFYLYYRDRALCLALGMTPTEMLLAAVAAADDPCSHGRQMASHWGQKALHIANSSSPTGTQFLNAVGAAEAWLRYDQIEDIPDRDEKIKSDEVIYVSSGEGATSEGEFWEAMNTASNLKLPVLFMVEDNGFAISVPVEIQTAGASVSKLVSTFPDLYIEEVDGCDPIASYDAVSRAAAVWSEHAADRAGRRGAPGRCRRRLDAGGWIQRRRHPALSTSHAPQGGGRAEGMSHFVGEPQRLRRFVSLPPCFAATRGLTGPGFFAPPVLESTAARTAAPPG